MQGKKVGTMKTRAGLLRFGSIPRCRKLVQRRFPHVPIYAAFIFSPILRVDCWLLLLNRFPATLLRDWHERGRLLLQDILQIPSYKGQPSQMAVDAAVDTVCSHRRPWKTHLGSRARNGASNRYVDNVLSNETIRF